VDDGEQCMYGMEMQFWGNSFLVDAKKEGNEFRYLQNSHRPNVQMRDVQVSQKKIGGTVPGVFSIVPIHGGKTELTTLYSSFPDLPEHFLACHCKAMKCTRFQSIRDPILTPNYIHKTSPYLAVSSLSPSTVPLTFIVRPYLLQESSPFSRAQSSLSFYKSGKVFLSSPNTSPSPPPHNLATTALLTMYTLNYGHYYYIDCGSLPLIGELMNAGEYRDELCDALCVSRFLALVVVQNTSLAIFQVSNLHLSPNFQGTHGL